jgi:hypothetical protein
MTDPHDPDSIPMLTDVIVPGRPPLARPGGIHADPAAVADEQRLSGERAMAQTAVGTPSERAVTPQPAVSFERPDAGMSAAAEPVSTATASTSPALDHREVDLIAERLRTRFASYLRQDARGVIEARCKDAVQEHTNWLVRQVTRDVVIALEAEVTSWVRDAVREELARHTSQR